MDQTPGMQPMPTLPGLDSVEQHCWQQFLGCSLNLMAALNVRLKGDHDLTIRDVMLLDLLSRPDSRGRRIRALAQRMRVSPGMMSAHIRRMEARGLVDRSPNRADPRGFLPTVTGEGHARLYAVLETYAQGVRAHYLDQLQREQMMSLVDSCRRINDSLAAQG
ncbi:MarR family winged helix-turn-helix transcriptional regulator [[Mycobacterium] nativiensis]|uniref:MarR family transcriptional regulator n=1 Tax=[Mycobacterium] nativiensis TaxID=2855503 RepID=A0ABU5Y0R0_9MYCO|nr:MarR family transcriptional regulator [Mycolicibacter sp. MYC340]MEB3033839.1 MarR family transcriptional regulator [Mycolicibacter sp. MYC340]